jgi:hypothetical protein
MIQYYKDSFPQADENPLSSGGKWSVGTTGVPLKVVGNKVRSSALVNPGPYNTGIFGGFTPTPDQMVSCRLATLNPANPGVTSVILFLRADVAGNNGYEIFFVMNASGSSQRAEMWALVAGVETAINTPPTITMTVGDIYTAVAIGSSIFVYQNGVLITKATDTNIASGKGQVGLMVQPPGAIGDVEITDVIVRDYTGVGRIDLWA